MSKEIKNMTVIEDDNEMFLTGFGYIHQDIKPNYDFDNQTEKKV